MEQDTEQPTVTAEPAARWCHWHRGPSQGTQLVRIIDVASGPGGGLYACAPCREQHHLTEVS